MLPSAQSLEIPRFTNFTLAYLLMAQIAYEKKKKTFMLSGVSAMLALIFVMGSPMGTGRKIIFQKGSQCYMMTPHPPSCAKYHHHPIASTIRGCRVYHRHSYRSVQRPGCFATQRSPPKRFSDSARSHSIVYDCEDVCLRQICNPVDW